MLEREIPFLTIAELSSLIRDGEVSPVEVTEAFLERIERYQDKTSAYITVTANRALDDARASEVAIRDGENLGPLHGIPLALKDLLNTKGIRTTSGSKYFGNFLPDQSSVVATRLMQAGMVLLGKANMVEFAFGPYGFNPHYGTPPNPWDRTRVPGGSSSGSGVVVRMGMAVAAIGTDTGGSIRIPASFCGIVGLKPTLERVSRIGVTPLSRTLDSVGPMTKCVEDAAFMLSAIADPVEDFSVSLKNGIKGFRIGVARLPFFVGADPQVLSCVEKAVGVIDNLGARVEEFYFPEAEQILEGIGPLVVMRVEGYTEHREKLIRSGEIFDPEVRDRLQLGAGVLATDYFEILQKREQKMASAIARLEEVDAVVVPTMLIQAPKVGELTEDQPLQLTTRVVNWLGLCAISVPCGFTSDGLPVGLQVIGKPFDEATILRIAYAYEQSTEWRLRIPEEF